MNFLDQIKYESTDSRYVLGFDDAVRQIQSLLFSVKNIAKAFVFVILSLIPFIFLFLTKGQLSYGLELSVAFIVSIFTSFVAYGIITGNIN